jgi:AcrR family transcriptional regulator
LDGVQFVDVATKRTAGQRAGLTRELVLAEARTLLSEQGLPALTMRGLATRLDVQPNALYSHVAGKDELVEALLDGALAQVPSPREGVGWRDGLHALMTATHHVLLAAPDLAPLYLGTGSRGPEAQRLGTDMLGLLERAGLTGAAAREAMRVLIVYTIGFAGYTTRAGFPGDDEAARRAELTANFDRGLDWLLAGIAG